MSESKVKNKTSLAKINRNVGRLKATKQVVCGNTKDIMDTSLVHFQSSCEQLSEKLPVKAGGVTLFVPVISKCGDILMPTTPCRAKQLIKEGKAKKQFFKGIFFIRLINRESGDTQQVVVGIDPGSKREAYTVKSSCHTYLNILSNAIDWVKKAMNFRRQMRRARRNRNTPYRKCKFNRTLCKLTPSIKARWQLKLRISKILCKLFPITDFVIEDVKAKSFKNAKRWNVNFSIIEVGKKWFYNEIKKLGKLHLKCGWETKLLRDEAGLKKTNSKLKVFLAHNVDSFVLANSLICDHKVVPDNTSIFKLDSIQFHRRQLHVAQPKIGFRKSYGGTMSLGFKKGSLVCHTKYGFCYIGGSRTNRLSLHDISDGHRLCQNAKKENIKFLAFNSFNYYQIC
jgi:hypothetical protein